MFEDRGKPQSTSSLRTRTRKVVKVLVFDVEREVYTASDAGSIIQCALTIRSEGKRAFSVFEMQAQDKQVRRMPRT